MCHWVNMHAHENRADYPCGGQYRSFVVACVICSPKWDACAGPAFPIGIEPTGDGTIPLSAFIMASNINHAPPVHR